MTRIVVVGGGIGGLTTAAALARAGMDVTVLEAHIYPGGCAGTFFHRGYRFDAGATLAGGFYPGGPMDRVAEAAGVSSWPMRTAQAAMAVHLPGSEPVVLTAGEDRWERRHTAFGTESDRFFRWQESVADNLWELALSLPIWPPQDGRQAFKLAWSGLAWLARNPTRRLHPSLLADSFRPVASHLLGAAENLRLFVDAQLLISAQTTSERANALFGASALDLPRRGVVHLEGGMGAIAQELVKAVRGNGGRVFYRQDVVQVNPQKDRTFEVQTRRGEHFQANQVIFNLPASNIRTLLGEAAPRYLRDLDRPPEDGWGAFVVYLGIEAPGLPTGYPLHHQVVVREPLGEGNSLFLSLSPAWDSSRAPAGHRALTLSTHTALPRWWQLHQENPGAYAALKEEYTARLLAAAEIALPGLQSMVRLALPGTPVTFHRFTRRQRGWVGGYPQTSLARTQGPVLQGGLWMVGDSIFPGQSVPAVALGGLRIAGMILDSLEVKNKKFFPNAMASAFTKKAVG